MDVDGGNMICLCPNCRYKQGCWYRSAIKPECDDFQEDLKPAEYTIGDYLINKYEVKNNV